MGWLQQGGGAIAGGAKNFGGTLSKGFKGAGGLVSGGFKGAGGLVSKGFKGAGGLVSKGAKDAGGEVSKGAKDAGGEVSKGAKDTGAVVSGGVKDTGGVVSKGAKDAGGEVSKGVKDAGGHLSDGVQSIVASSESVLNTYQKVIEDPLHADKAIGEEFEKLREKAIEPHIKNLQEASDDISKATKPMTDVITKEVAPVLKDAVEATTRASNLQAEALLKGTGALLGALGDEASQRTLNKNADDLADSARDVAELSGEIVTAKNAVRVGATAAGSALGGPLGGVAANTLLDAVDGQTITFEKVALNVATSYIGGMDAGISNQALNSVVNEVLKEDAELIAKKLINGENLSWNELRDATLSGAVKGASSGVLDDVLSGSESPDLAKIIKSAASSTTSDIVDQYQQNGNINIAQATTAFAGGAMRSGFNQAVELGIDVTTTLTKTELNEREIDEDGDEYFDLSTEDTDYAADDIDDQQIDDDAEYYDLENESPDRSQDEMKSAHNTQRLDSDLGSIGEKTFENTLEKVAEEASDATKQSYKKTQKAVEQEAAKKASKEFKDDAKQSGDKYSKKNLKEASREARREAGKKHLDKGQKVSKGVKLGIENMYNAYKLATSDDLKQTTLEIAVDKAKDYAAQTLADKIGDALINGGSKFLGEVVKKLSPTTVLTLMESKDTGAEADLKSADTAKSDQLIEAEKEFHKILKEQRDIKLKESRSLESITCDDYDNCVDQNGDAVFTNGASLPISHSLLNMPTQPISGLFQSIAFISTNVCGFIGALNNQAIGEDKEADNSKLMTTVLASTGALVLLGTGLVLASWCCNKNKREDDIIIIDQGSVFESVFNNSIQQQQGAVVGNYR